MEPTNQIFNVKFFICVTLLPFTKLLTNVFITFNIQVNRCITDILKLCKEFYLEMSKEDISDESLKAMNERLDLSVSMLMSFITLLGGKAEGLRLLLLRLDYNRFFSLRSSWTQTRRSCQVNHSLTQKEVLHSVYSRTFKAVGYLSSIWNNSIKPLVAIIINFLQPTESEMMTGGFLKDNLSHQQ